MILHLIHLTWYFHIDYYRMIKIHSSVNKFLSSLMRKHDVYNLERESKQQGKTSAIFIFYYSQQKLKMFEKWKSFFGKFSDTSCLFHETLISFWKFYITEFYLFSMFFSACCINCYMLRSNNQLILLQNFHFVWILSSRT